MSRRTLFKWADDVCRMRVNDVLTLFIPSAVPDSASSATVSGAASLIIFGALQIFGGALVAQEEPKLIIFAGFLCSLIFFFATIVCPLLLPSAMIRLPHPTYPLARV
jgi:hypothetical protein